MIQTRRLLLAILLTAFAGACLLSASAQQSSNGEAESYALAEAEAQQWAQLTQIEKNAFDAYQAAINRAVNTPVGEQSKEIHAAVQSGWLALSLVRTQKEAFTAKLQAEHACKGYQIVNGKLTKLKGDFGTYVIWGTVGGAEEHVAQYRVTIRGESYVWAGLITYAPGKVHGCETSRPFFCATFRSKNA